MPHKMSMKLKLTLSETDILPKSWDREDTTSLKVSSECNWKILG